MISRPLWGNHTSVEPHLARLISMDTSHLTAQSPVFRFLSLSSSGCLRLGQECVIRSAPALSYFLPRPLFSETRAAASLEPATGRTRRFDLSLTLHHLPFSPLNHARSSHAPRCRRSVPFRMLAAQVGLVADKQPTSPADQTDGSGRFRPSGPVRRSVLLHPSRRSLC